MSLRPQAWVTSADAIMFSLFSLFDFLATNDFNNYLAFQYFDLERDLKHVVHIKLDIYILYSYKTSHQGLLQG